MEISETLRVVRSLADGVDPISGESYPMSSPYQHPQVVRALFHAVYALQVLRQREKRRDQLPENAGRSWSPEEDEDLLVAAKAGDSLDELAASHKRSREAITARLAKLTLPDVPGSPDT